MRILAGSGSTDENQASLDGYGIGTAVERLVLNRGGGEWLPSPWRRICQSGSRRHHIPVGVGSSILLACHFSYHGNRQPAARGDSPRVVTDYHGPATRVTRKGYSIDE
jgi:hypothetical protein